MFVEINSQILIVMNNKWKQMEAKKEDMCCFFSCTKTEFGANVVWLS